MKRLSTILPTLVLALTLSGCELIGDIFRIGFWGGVIVVLLLVGAVVWLVRMLGGRRGGPPPA